jgi:hypothetical protein
MKASDTFTGSDNTGELSGILPDTSGGTSPLVFRIQRHWANGRYSHYVFCSYRREGLLLPPFGPFPTWNAAEDATVAIRALIDEPSGQTE